MTITANRLRKLILIVLCLKVFIPMYQPIRPHNAHNNNKVYSETRKRLLLALYLSTHRAMKVIQLIRRKYTRSKLDMVNT